MPFLEELINQSRLDISQQQTYSARDVGLRNGQAYSSYFPNYEVTSPQFITPSAYNMAQMGYRSNELVYSIISRRARAKAQAHITVKRENGTKTDEDQPLHGLLKLMRKPNPTPNLTERMFWQVKQVTQDIAGFSAWEIEYNNLGEPIGLWYMTPFYCSFLRGQQQPLRAIRYQPYGLEPVDIPMIDEEGRPKILFFSNGEDFDPLYPGIKFWSPTMAAFPEIRVDNSMTFFLNDFMKNGARFSGLISLAQTIDESQAATYRRLWRMQHGGVENWSDPLILGDGAKYEAMQLNFKDMAFPELDARVGARICNAFSIDPIVAGAKAGTDVSTYNNKKQAHTDWHYEWVVPSWKDDEDALTNQMLPAFGTDPNEYYCEFDISEVYSLREDRDAQVKRATELFKSKVATKNEAREEVDLEPVADGDEFAADAPAGFDENGKPVPPKPGENKPEEKPKSQAEIDAADAEEKKFRAFAKRRIKEGKLSDLPEYEFKHIEPAKRRDLLIEFGVPMPEDADRVLKALAIATKAAVEIESL
jgi:HK97 family phage portal protein